MELLRSTSRGGFSVRSIFTFVLAALVTVLLWAISVSPTASAAPTGDAHWKGESIVYSGKQYFPAAEAKSGESHGLAAGTQYYVAVEQISERPLERKAHVIYFAPGTDPPTATSANYVVYDYSSDNEFSDPTGRQSVVMVPEGESTSGAASSCSVDGIGWFICPVTVFLAEAMDNIFKMVAAFVEVQPLVVNDTTSPLYISWNVMRSIANVAFIVAFLIIIYSQLTGWGVSNYGLKKLLPRLVVAAVLVNISFYISALAVDISNLLGYGLQEILINIREDTFSITNDTLAATANEPWSVITGAILSGGAAVGGVAYLAGMTGGSLAASLYLLIPLLAALVLTVLFVLLILAARQAIIIILIVISPLAFVANLLPNTEKWFDKWKDLFMTMLIFFPAFSLVFGGSQLAGGIIIQNATNVIMMIFGLAVQVAPLIITPLLLKLSGGLLGRIAGLINDPRKGAMDRAKSWAGDRAAMHRNRSLQSKAPGTGLNPMRRIAQRMDINRRYVKRATDAYESGIEANALERDQDRYLPLAAAEKSAELRKGQVENTLKTAVQQDINITGSRLHSENVNLEASNLKLNEETERSKAIIEEYKSGRFAAPTAALSTTMQEMRESLNASSAQAQRAESAHFVQQSNIARAFTDETVAARALAHIAAGVDENGAIRAQAKYEANLNKLELEALDNSVKLLNFKAIRNGQTLKQYAANVVEQQLSGNIQNPQELDAALEAAAKDGNVSLLRRARVSDRFDQQALTKLFDRNSGTMKEKGGFDLQANPDLALASKAVMNASIAGTIGEITGENIPKVKAGFWGDVSKSIRTIIDDSSSAELNDAQRREAESGLKKAYVTITEALEHEDAGIQLGDRMVETIRIHKALHERFGDPKKIMDYTTHLVRNDPDTDAELNRTRDIDPTVFNPVRPPKP